MHETCDVIVETQKCKTLLIHSLQCNTCLHMVQLLHVAMKYCVLPDRNYCRGTSTSMCIISHHLLYCSVVYYTDSSVPGLHKEHIKCWVETSKKVTQKVTAPKTGCGFWLFPPVSTRLSYALDKNYLSKIDL